MYLDKLNDLSSHVKEEKANSRQKTIKSNDQTFLIKSDEVNYQNSLSPQNPILISYDQ